MPQQLPCYVPTCAPRQKVQARPRLACSVRIVRQPDTSVRYCPRPGQSLGRAVGARASQSDDAEPADNVPELPMLPLLVVGTFAAALAALSLAVLGHFFI